MKTDLYNKIMLTLIAACLVALVIQNQSARRPEPTRAGALDVNIVGVTRDLPVAIQSQKSDAGPKTPLEVTIVGTTKELPVAIQKSDDTQKTPLEVKIVGATAELPVTVQNQKGFEFPTGPIDINIKSIGGDTLNRVGSQVVLPVGVRNTVDVDVKGLNGRTMSSSILSAGGGAAGFPVVILNK
jgi:hypothetical protein